MINISPDVKSKITKITTQKRPGRYNIFLNDEYAFAVSEETLIHFRLTKGMEIDGKLLEEIGAYEDVATAYNQALTYITGQLRTTKEVEKKLQKNEASESAIKQVIAKLNDLNLLDDSEYAKSYVRTMLKTSDKGPRYLKNHLRQKGVLEKDLEQGLALYTLDDEINLATQVGTKYQKKQKPISIKQQKLKVRQTLMNKGFGNEAIEQALLEINFQVDEEAEYEKLAQLGERLLKRHADLTDYSKKAKIKQSLFNKGYETELIERFLSNHQL